MIDGHLQALPVTIARTTPSDHQLPLRDWTGALALLEEVGQDAHALTAGWFISWFISGFMASVQARSQQLEITTIAFNAVIDS